MPLTQLGRPRRDSWPPTQVRLKPADEHDDDSLDGIDENPLTYFLTPTPAFDIADGSADMMDFDAGIEDVNHPREIVRSVSPSSLDGLKRPGRKVSPDRDTPEVTTPVDDDDEDYIRFQPKGLALPLHLRDLVLDGIKAKSRLSMSVPTLAADALLSPNTFHGPTARGRTPARGHGHAKTRGLSARRRPQHLWREPSPDVWSIEETEEELNSEMGDSMVKSDAEDESNIGKPEHLELPAAKPKKKVRFVLPPRE